MLAFYFWAAAPAGDLFSHFNGASAYYNLLIKGFQSGHLHLAVPTPPALLQVKDPYDPKENVAFGMHDASYYKGRFYLYFGPAPALALYWPFAAVTGKYLEDAQALFIFCSLGFLAAALLVASIRRVYFPRLGILTEVAGVLAVGLANMVPVLLRREQIYEVAVGSADCFFLVSLVTLFLGLHARRRNRWLAAASLAYGLAVAARPTYLFGGGILILPVVAEWWQGRKEGGTRRRGWRRRALATMGPAALIGIGLLLYNYLRFDNPLEFGQRLAFSGSDETRVTHFSLSYVLYNCRLYLFAPAGLSSYFPFVRVIWLPKAPPGHYGAEDPFGIFPNIPFIFFAFLAPVACWGRPRLAKFAAAVGLASVAVAAVIFTFQFATNRYMVDFLPGFVLLAVIGFWGFLNVLGRPARFWAGALGGMLLSWSVLFNIFAAFNHNELLRINNPAVFLRLLHFFDQPRYWFDRVAGRVYGPVEVTLKLPRDRQGKLEPLIITGTQFLSDYLYLYFVDRDHIEVGFEHSGYGGPVSPPLKVDYAVSHRFLVDLAPLYPPRGDPYFDHASAGNRAEFREHMRVSLDGADIFNTSQETFPAYHERPLVGRSAPGQESLGVAFTGKIENVRILPKDWAALQRSEMVGPIVLSLIFPANAAGAHEPIIATGASGRGDVLVLNYLDASHATLSLDHWGYGGPTSAPFVIKPGARQEMEVSLGSFYPPAQRPADANPQRWADASKRLRVVLDHHVIMDVPAQFFDVPSDSVSVGANPIGASSCTATFSGTVLGFYRGTLD